MDGVVCCGVPRKIRGVEVEEPMPVFVRYPYPYFPPFQGVVVTQLRFLAARPDETPPYTNSKVYFRSQRQQGRNNAFSEIGVRTLKVSAGKIAELKNPFRIVLFYVH